MDLMPGGRHRAGERWAFHSYSSRLDIRRTAQRVAYDAIDLNDGDGNVRERFNRFDVLGTVIVTGPAFGATAADLVRGASTLQVRPAADLVLAAWPLADRGALVRIAGTGVEQVTAELRNRLGFLRAVLGDDPWARKW